MKDRLKEYYHRWCEAEGCSFHGYTSYAGKHYFCKQHRVINTAVSAVEHAQVKRTPRTATWSLPIAVLLKE